MSYQDDFDVPIQQFGIDMQINLAETLGFVYVFLCLVKDPNCSLH